MKSLVSKKFILPTLAVLIGAAMVWTDTLEGSQWAMMTTTLITGFYAIQGWDIRISGGKKDGNESSKPR